MKPKVIARICPHWAHPARFELLHLAPDRFAVTRNGSSANAAPQLPSLNTRQAAALLKIWRALATNPGNNRNTRRIH